MKKVKVRNPIAHANGGVSQGKTITGKKIDASKLQEGSLEVFQARKKLKAMFEEFKGKIKTCEMPSLAHYFRIGYGSRADYKDFGHKIWDIPEQRHSRLLGYKIEQEFRYKCRMGKLVEKLLSADNAKCVH